MRGDEGLFRLAVDRVFTLPGQGTIVTGTVFAGQVRVEDTIAVAPRTDEALSSRVRSIHAQNRPSQVGRAGQRCALNLSGVSRDAIRRGDWIVDPRLMRQSMRIDCTMSMLPDGAAASSTTLAHWTPVHVHIGSARFMAHTVLLDAERLGPGQQGRVQLVLDRDASTVPGDRFILRNAQADRTIGGGYVLDPFAPSRQRRSEARAVWHDALQQWLDHADVGPLLAASCDGMAETMLTHLSGRPMALLSLPEDAIVLTLGGEAKREYGQWVFDAQCWSALAQHAMSDLAHYHERYVDEQGVEVTRLRRMVLPQLDGEVWSAIVQRWLQEGRMVLSGPWLHLASHTITLDAKEEALAARVMPCVQEGRYDPPWVRDIAKSVEGDEETIRLLMRKLSAQGRVLQVVKDLFYDKAHIIELARLAAKVARESADQDSDRILRQGEVLAARFRDASGLGRKRAIQVLEFFDRVGYTRRHRDSHLLRPDSRWLSLLEQTGESEDADAPVSP
jgi:selenocysteine-specific elongation factor